MEQGERNIARSYGGDNLYHSNERPEIIILRTVVYNSAKASYTNHAAGAIFTPLILPYS